MNPFAPDSPPNLDGLSIDPDDYEEAAQIFRHYADYCRAKARATRNRLQGGDVEYTLRWETRCDGIYKSLPSDARW